MHHLVIKLDPNFHYNQDYQHLESFSELFYNTQILTNYI